VGVKRATAALKPLLLFWEIPGIMGDGGEQLAAPPPSTLASRKVRGVSAVSLLRLSAAGCKVKGAYGD